MIKEEVKVFYLNRLKDSSGVSGTGVVAVGIQFPSGQCVIEWCTYHRSIGLYGNVGEIEKIHGHNGDTQVVWGEVVEDKSPKRSRKKAAVH